jgi:hypothetical protein
MIVHLYRYPHPFIRDKWLYVGQGPGRDKVHRAANSSFDRRFRKLFSDTPLPKPIRWTEPVVNHLEANETETMAMLKYHTWHGYPGGMNLTLSGSIDYGNAGIIGGNKALESGQIASLGRIQGRKNVENGHLALITRKENQSKGGKTQGQKNLESGHLAIIASQGGKVGGKVAGRKNVESGHLAAIRNEENQSKGAKICCCLRWNIRRGRPCTCGKHAD